MASSCTSEQRLVIKFYVLLGKSFTEIRDDLHKVYGDSCLANSAISKWMRRFKDGRESTEDDKHTGRPVTITTEKKVAEIQEFILEDRRVTVETVTKHFDISYGTAQDIMTILSSECAAFQQDGYRACCFLIKWDKGSKGVMNTVNVTKTRAKTF